MVELEFVAEQNLSKLVQEELELDDIPGAEISTEGIKIIRDARAELMEDVNKEDDSLDSD